MALGHVEVNKQDLVPPTEPDMHDNFKNQGKGTEIQFVSNENAYLIFGTIHAQRTF